ncbi:hypothetical protein TPHA_0A04690 [Tetrapisispora phaffii CBS 4417]|uniref:Crh-like protein n=1 Tax=Tetrapisispora phaffii (strain ATCC 24235 / CBS 4417 / NBRC 1672 / NRRL Y-8282 / UCD 70-5) TaxID=1071381 RepID=G8BNR4_TETPH|nr:hypothetical protein TPHA_0A04690 [Tetrapisispora phaffii CBS 4417]CCE61542.1 hypothetical protein TPHA_0A04690 [Tetrapisispora phaffii CBS 4417]
MLFSRKNLLVALSVLSIVKADSCNPLTATDCSAETALGTSFSEDFTSESKHFASTGNPGKINYTSDGLEVTLAKRFDNPSLKSDFYIMYGKFEVIAKAAAGQGIISSVFLQSEDLDEIDIEWVGGDTTQFQTNFFSKGDTTTYDRGAFHSVSSPQEEYHNYTVDWRMDRTDFYLDGAIVRTLANDTSSGYPQSPMAIFIGIWAGGDPSNAAGTIEWAGGLTDYTKAPFTMNVQSIIVSDYSSGSQYSYSDQTGSWQSIQAKDGTVYGRVSKGEQEFAALVAGSSISALDASVSSAVSSSASSTSAEASSTSEEVSSTTSTEATSTEATSTEATSSELTSESSAEETTSTALFSSVFESTSTSELTTTEAVVSDAAVKITSTSSFKTSMTSANTTTNSIALSTGAAAFNKAVTPFSILMTLFFSLL